MLFKMDFLEGHRCWLFCIACIQYWSCLCQQPNRALQTPRNPTNWPASQPGNGDSISNAVGHNGTVVVFLSGNNIITESSAYAKPQVAEACASKLGQQLQPRNHGVSGSVGMIIVDRAADGHLC